MAKQRPHDPHRAARRRATCGATRRSTTRRSSASASDVVTGTGAHFVAEKLDERNARHQRMGDSRYVVEPNVKEGKGGLRDLHDAVLDRQVYLPRARCRPSWSSAAC